MADDRRSANRPLSFRTLVDLIDKVRLAWRLFRDDRVSTAAKAIPLAGLVYIIWPIDLLPDLFPALGQLDDIAVLLLALNAFVRACPSDVVRDVQSVRETISARYTVVDRDDEKTQSQ